jgi:hypothetical protein
VFVVLEYYLHLLRARLRDHRPVVQREEHRSGDRNAHPRRGLATPIFIPLTKRLIENMGWRSATLVLAAVLLALVGTLALVFLRDRPREEARRERLDPKGTYGTLVRSFRYTDPTFWLVSASFFLGFAANFALLFHQVAYLRELGLSAGTAALAAGLAGLVGLPGRFPFPILGELVRPSFVVAAVFLMLVLAGALLPGAEERGRLYLYVGLSGICFGTILPIRAVIMGRHFGGPLYGRLMGLQFTLLSLAIAGGPLAARASCETFKRATPSFRPWLSPCCSWRPPPSSPPNAARELHEDVQREQGADQRVGHVHRLANAKIHRHAAERVSLLRCITPRFEMLDHVEERVSGGDGDVLALVSTVLPHADAGGGEEPTRNGQLRRGEVVVSEKL